MADSALDELDSILGKRKPSASDPALAELDAIVGARRNPYRRTESSLVGEDVALAPLTQNAKRAAKVALTGLGHISNALSSTERFGAGAVKESLGPRAVETFGPFSTPAAIIAHPGKALRGGWSAATKGTYSGEQLQRDIEEQQGKKLSPGAHGVASFIRGAEVDPLTIFGGVIGRGGGALLKSLRGASKSGKLGGGVANVERSADILGRMPRRERSATMFEHSELARRAAAPDVAEHVDAVQRSAEAVQEELLAQAAKKGEDSLKAAARSRRVALREGERQEKKAAALTTKANLARSRVTGDPRLYGKSQALSEVARSIEGEAGRGVTATPAQVLNLRPSEGPSGIARLARAEEAAKGRVQDLTLTPLAETTNVSQATAEGLRKMPLVPEAEWAAKQLTKLRASAEKAQERIVAATTAAEERAAKDALVRAQAGIAKMERKAVRMRDRAASLQGRALESSESLARKLDAKAVAATTRLVTLQTEATRAAATMRQLTGGSDTVSRGTLVKAAMKSRAEALPEVTRQANMAAGNALLQVPEGVRGKTLKIVEDIQALGKSRRGALVRAGAMGEETLERPYYLRRSFERYEHPADMIEQLRLTDPALAEAMEHDLRGGARVGGLSLRPDPAKARQALSQGTMESLGELSVAERLALQGRVSGALEANAIVLKRIGRRWAKDAIPAGRGTDYFQVADAKHWGNLRGKYVPKWLASWMGMAPENTSLKDKLIRLALPTRGGEFSNVPVISRSVSAFKWAHAVANLPTVRRNATTNLALAYVLTDVPAWRLPSAVLRGLKATIGKSEGSKATREFLSRATPGYGSTMVEEELRQAFKRAKGDPGTFARLFWNTKLGKATERIYQDAGRIYEIAEQSGKAGVFEDLTRHGMSKQKAVRQAIGALFDYGDFSYFGNMMRRLGILPFATYPVKATRALAAGVIQRPGKFAMLNRIPRAIGEAGRQMDPEGVDQSQQYMPGSFRDFLAGGAGIPLPSKDKEGKQRWYAHGYEMPWGPSGEEMGGFSPRGMLPMSDVISSLKRNQDAFTKKPIWNEETDSEAEKKRKQAVYLAQWVLPPAPVKAIGDVKKAMSGGGSWTDVVARLAGVRSYPVDVKDVRRSQAQNRNKRKKLARKEVGGKLRSREVDEKLEGRRRLRNALDNIRWGAQ